MKQTIKKVLIITIYIGLVLISTKVYATSGKTNEKTNLRKEPSTNASVVTVISPNTEVEIIEASGEWYKVKTSNNTGYIRKDLLSVKEEVNTKNENTTVSEERKAEGTNSNTTNVETNVTKQQNEISNQEQKAESNEELNKKETPATNIGELPILQKGYSGNLKTKLEVKILPVINSSVVASLEANTQFVITDIINKWCYIEAESNSGWALISKVQTNVSNSEEKAPQESEEKAPEVKEENKEDKKTEETNNNSVAQNETVESKTTETTKYVSVEYLNLREKADGDSKVVGQLKVNMQVTVLEATNDSWSKVKANGKTGYVASKYLSDTKVDTSSRSEDLARKEAAETNAQNNSVKENPTPVANTSTSNNAKGSSIAEYSKNYLGYRYVLGGTSPSTGFDCSGLTYYVYKNFGITLNRTADAQASNGVEVSKADLQEGDLILFYDSSKSYIGHVGIYIGGNTFLHAANPQKGVVTTSLSNSYYAERYVSARRLTN